jgi:hypothetical protein
MDPRYERDAALAAELCELALGGDLDAACLLGVVEAAYPIVSKLDANPEAAAVYLAAREVERERLDDEWHEMADQVAAALL